MSIVDKVKHCLTNRLIPWLDNDLARPQEILIRSEIKHDLNIKYGIGSLQLLAEILGWTFSKQYWIKESRTNISCVIVHMDKFIEFLSGNPQKEEPPITTRTEPIGVL
jgi:hypothetical protein